MRYTLLGNSGLRVSELALGTMTFGPDWGWGADEPTSRKMFERFAEAGGNFVDTADKYTAGSSERIVGDLVRADRDYFVLATKYSLATRENDPNTGGNHRKNLVQSLDASLRRLGTDYVDLLWVHAWDFLTGVDEVMRALDDQVRLGKVLYVGISDTPAWIVSRAQTVAELRGWTPFAGLQVEYSLVQRDVERELLPMARALGLGITAWSPLGGGLLTGKFNAGSAGVDTGGRLGAVDEDRLRIPRAVAAVAAELGVPSSHVALAWLRAQRDVVPIVGARTVDQLDENLGALDLALPEDALRRLDEVSAIRLGWPHDFLEAVPGVLFGEGVRERIDVPARRRLV